MASVYVAEYSRIASVSSILGARDNPTMAPQEPSLVEQVIPITGSTTSGSVFNPSTQLIRVHADAICSIVIGTGPAATTANKRLAANQTEFFGVGFGQTIAVISNV